MQIKILYFSGCPMWETAAVRVHTVLAELGRADVAVQVEDVNQASHLSSEWAGSPTVLLDGARDACRIYVTEAGFEGAPSLDQLRTALTPVLTDHTR